MRYLVISDIHGNLPALEAVLEDAPTYDAVLCLGDTVGYGASPNQCVEVVRQLSGLVCLVGNHDLAALGAVDIRLFNDVAAAAARWTSSELAPENRSYLESLQPSAPLDSVHLAHASPRDPIWEYMEEPSQGPPNFASFEGPLCLVGHTHVPRIFSATKERTMSVVRRPAAGEVLSIGAGRAILNPGAVGQPRDGDWRAAYGVLDLDAQTFAFRRVEYPVNEAQAAIRQAGLPAVLAMRLEVGA